MRYINLRLTYLITQSNATIVRTIGKINIATFRDKDNRVLYKKVSGKSPCTTIALNSIVR